MNNIWIHQSQSLFDQSDCFERMQHIQTDKYIDKYNTYSQLAAPSPQIKSRSVIFFWLGQAELCTIIIYGFML